MEASQFRVVVQGSLISPEDWSRAMRAPASELPELTDEQKHVARGLKISQTEYAKGELARLYGQERISERGEQLGELVGRMLETLGAGYRLTELTAQMTKLRWVLTLKTPSGETSVFVPRDLADDVLDWGPREKVEELKSRLRYGLGLEEVAGKPRR